MYSLWIADDKVEKDLFYFHSYHDTKADALKAFRKVKRQLTTTVGMHCKVLEETPAIKRAQTSLGIVLKSKD